MLKKRLLNSVKGDSAVQVEVGTHLAQMPMMIALWSGAFNTVPPLRARLCAARILRLSIRS